MVQVKNSGLILAPGKKDNSTAECFIEHSVSAVPGNEEVPVQRCSDEGSQQRHWNMLILFTPVTESVCELWTE